MEKVAREVRGNRWQQNVCFVRYGYVNTLAQNK